MEPKTRTATQRTSDGHVIIAAEQALAPHPHPSQNGRLVPFSYVTELLLENGDTRYRCDYPVSSGKTCGKDTFTKVSSVSPHMSGAHGDRGSMYPEETLRVLVRLFRTFKEAGRRNYAELTAEELTKRGVPTLDGDPWTSTQVSALFAVYGDRIRTHVRQSQLDLARGGDPASKTTKTEKADPRGSDEVTPATRPAQPAPAPTTPTRDTSLAALDRRTTELTRRITQMFDAYRQLASDFADYAQDVGTALTEAAANVPDASVLDKARRWDDMQKLLGNK